MIKPIMVFFGIFFPTGTYAGIGTKCFESEIYYEKYIKKIKKIRKLFFNFFVRAPKEVLL